VWWRLLLVLRLLPWMLLQLLQQLLVLLLSLYLLLLVLLLWLLLLQLCLLKRNLLKLASTERLSCSVHLASTARVHLACCEWS